VVPLFVGYALIVWFVAARHRRRFAGFVAVALGLAGLLGLNFLHGRLNDWTNGTIYLPVLRSIMYPYTALVVMVGGFIVCLPRESITGCRRCGYSLHGLDRRFEGVVCPECGTVQHLATPYRRSGMDRDDLGLSDRPSAPQRPGDEPAREHEQGQPSDQPPAQRPEHARG
jgi:hypothetical protein